MPPRGVAGPYEYPHTGPHPTPAQIWDPRCIWDPRLRIIFTPYKTNRRELETIRLASEKKNRTAYRKTREHRSMHAIGAIPCDGMNHPAEGLASHMRVHDGDFPCKCPLDLCVGGKPNGRHSQHVTQFIILEPSRLLGLPNPAPPPKLHYSTWWRSITRRIYRANASSAGFKKLEAGMQIHAPASQN